MASATRAAKAKGRRFQKIIETSVGQQVLFR